MWDRFIYKEWFIFYVEVVYELREWDKEDKLLSVL